MSKKAGKKAKVKVPEIDPDSPEWIEEVARKQSEAYDLVQRAMIRSQVIAAVWVACVCYASNQCWALNCRGTSTSQCLLGNRGQEFGSESTIHAHGFSNSPVHTYGTRGCAPLACAGKESS